MPVTKAASRCERRWIRDYVDEVLDERRRKPRDDFISKFLAAASAAL